MTITVRLFATFREFSPQGAAQSCLRIDVGEHENVQGLIRALGVPDELPKVILVNGIFASEDSRLQAGDTVSIFPPLIGG